MYLSGNTGQDILGSGVSNITNNSRYSKVLVDTGCRVNGALPIIGLDNVRVGLYDQDESVVMRYDLGNELPLEIRVGPGKGLGYSSEGMGLTVLQAVVFAVDDKADYSRDMRYQEIANSLSSDTSCVLSSRIRSLKLNEAKSMVLVTDDIESVDLGAQGAIEIGSYKAPQWKGVTYTGSAQDVTVVGLEDNETLNLGSLRKLVLEKPRALVSRVLNSLRVNELLRIEDTRYLVRCDQNFANGYVVHGNLEVDNVGPVVVNNLTLDFSGVMVQGDLTYQLYDMGVLMEGVVVAGETEVDIRGVANDRGTVLVPDGKLGKHLHIRDFIQQGHSSLAGWFEGSVVNGGIELSGEGSIPVEGISKLLKNVTATSGVTIKNYRTLPAALLEGLSGTIINIGLPEEVAERACYNLSSTKLVCLRDIPFDTVGSDAFTTDTPSVASGYRSNKNYHELTLAAGYEWEGLYSVFVGMNRVPVVYVGDNSVIEIYIGEVKL